LLGVSESTNLIIKQPHFKALIIGISHYDDLRPLEFCKNDAEELYEVLIEQGYEILDKNNLVGQINHDTVRNTIYDFFFDKNIKSKDTLLFYFSGHGVPDGYTRHYLAPSNYDRNNPGRNGYTFEDLDYCIENSKSTRILAILDCCFSGAAGLEGLKGDNDESAANKVREALDRKMKAASEGRCILASSLSEQESVINRKLQHSLFTYHLLDGLRGKKGFVDRDGYVTADLLGKYVFERMVDEPGVQKPIKKSKASGDILVAHYPLLAPEIPKPEPEQVNVSPTLSYTDEIKINRIVKQAEKYEVENDYGSAIDCYKEAIKIDPTYYALYNSMGACYFKRKKNEDAIKAFKGAITADPGHPDAYNFTGDVYFGLGDYNQAIEWYGRALKIRRSFMFLNDMGRAYFELKDYGQAIAIFEESLEIESDQSEVLKYKEDALLKFKEFDELEKGRSLYDLGKYDEALECFKRSLESNSKNTQTLHYKGSILLRQSKIDEAIACYEEILEIDSSNEKALEAKELALKEKKQKVIESLIKEGIKYKKKGDYRNAVDSFDKAIGLEPDNYVPYSYKGDIAFDYGEEDEALNCYNKVTEIEPKHY
jgi:tetratricopeptide (TPR) repeat protein